MIAPRFQDAAKILSDAADATARGIFHGVSIGLGNGAKASMTLTRSGAVGVKLSETIVTTVEDAVEMEQVQDE